MTKGFSKIVLQVLFVALFMTKGFATSKQDEQHILAALRMIGHEVLLQAGDSTSRVLPIAKESGRYKIPFDTEFAFNPVDLVAAVDRNVLQAKIAKRYIVSVEQCATGNIAYSYEVDPAQAPKDIPCGTRTQPKDCYNLWFTILADAVKLPENGSAAAMNFANPFLISMLVVSFLGVVGWVVFSQMKKKKGSNNPNMIAIGIYQFDRLNSVLLLDDVQQELSGKESDLLQLLYDAANTTLERDVILHQVWGDEGSYVGRTLDVFVSKLRKKLEADPNVKIVNIRGVGYKLVLNEEVND